MQLEICLYLSYGDKSGIFLSSSTLRLLGKDTSLKNFRGWWRHSVLSVSLNILTASANLSTRVWMSSESWATRALPSANSRSLTNVVNVLFLDLKLATLNRSASFLVWIYNPSELSLVFYGYFQAWLRGTRRWVLAQAHTLAWLHCLLAAKSQEADSLIATFACRPVLTASIMLMNLAGLWTQCQRPYWSQQRPHKVACFVQCISLVLVLSRKPCL